MSINVHIYKDKCEFMVINVHIYPDKCAHLLKCTFTIRLLFERGLYTQFPSLQFTKKDEVENVSFKTTETAQI